MSILTSPLAVFDLETTGVNVERDRVVTAHVGHLSPTGEISQRTDWLVNPGIEIPAGASAVHGISTDRAVAEGVEVAVGVAQIIEALNHAQDQGFPIVAYNAAYDLTLLDREARRYGLAPFEPRLVLDPLIIDKAVDRYRKGKRTLIAACETYGVALDAAHEASADAIAAGLVAQAILRAYPELDELSLDELHGRQQLWQREQAESFADWKRRNGEPSFVPEIGWPLRALSLS